MQANKVLFYSIIGLAILIAGGLFVARLILAEPLNLPTGSEEVEIEVIVAPAIKAWVDQAARDFNRANPRSQIRVVAADDLVPEAQFQTTNPAVDPPVAWLAEASFVVDMARDQGVNFDETQSVASSRLAWGSYNSKLDQFNQAYGPLTWQNVNAKGKNPGDRLQLVIAPPQNSAEGLAALAAAVAGNRGTNMVTANDVSASDAWLTQTFGNGNARRAATPGADFATKGISAGDFGILALASWRDSRLNSRPDFTITPTEPAVGLDYPFAIWSGSRPGAKAAAAAFRDHLLATAQQNSLTEFSWNRPHPARATSRLTASPRSDCWIGRTGSFVNGIQVRESYVE